MEKKSYRLVDPQGRVIIPPHIRKALNIAPGNTVEVYMDDNETICIKCSEERCAICGEGVEGRERAEITAGPSKKYVCYNCSCAIVRAAMK